jgi:ATP-binding cassette subfamily B protein/ATP-binding cassette subfamily C protein
MGIPLKQYGHLLADYLKPQQRRVIGLAIALFANIALQIVNPQIIAYFIDTAVVGDSSQTLTTAAILFIVVAFLTQVLSVTATYLSENIAWTATNALRSDLVTHCLNLDLSFHKSRTPGELIERVDGDVNTLSRFFSLFTINVLGNTLLLLGILVVLFFEDWRAGVGLSLFTLIALLTLVSLRSLAIFPWAAYRQLSAEFFGFIGEHIAGTEDIKANGATSYVMHRFYQFLQRWLPLYQKARFTATVLWGSTVGLFTLGNGIALGLAAYLWQQQAITIGTAYLLFHYTNLLQDPIEQIRVQLEDLQQAEASIYRIQDLLQIQSKLRNTDKQPLPREALAVAFEDVSFSYDLETAPRHNSTHQPPHSVNQAELVLNHISFSLPPGQILGLLGHTGSGKTTIARLLLRFYQPQSGCIRLGNIALDQTPLKDLPQHVGVVTQDVQLFQTTVRNNLTFFNPKIKDQQIVSVLEELGLADWLQSLSNGLDTILSADSGGLSAGQAQLLAFARVFLKNPGLIILDEASSRLDPVTEALIEQAVDKLLKDRTGIIIAHRLRTVQRAHQILILKQGRVLEYGDRATLANNPHSHYARLLKTGLTNIPV